MVIATSIAVIIACASKARVMARDVRREVAGAFTDAVDRNAITEMFETLEGVVSEMKQIAQAIQLYGITGLAPDMQNLAHVVVDAIDTAGMAIPLLRSVSQYREKLLGLATTLFELDGHADAHHDAGLRALFETASDAMAFIVRREIYAHLRRLTDGLANVANRIERLAA